MAVVLLSLLVGVSTVFGLSPVVLVPGLAGSVLEGKFSRPSVPFWDCTKNADWHTVFLSLWEASRPHCLINELSIFYDPNTGRYSNQAGIEIRGYDFGGIEGVVALDPDQQWLTKTFFDIAQDLQASGYVVRKNLFGVPYDFRMASAGLEQIGYYKQVQLIIEGAVKANGEPATIISHSMGCLVMQYFLQKMGEEWLIANVKDYIAISCPWQGAVPMLKATVSGDNFDLPIPDGLLHPLQSSAPSGNWLLPRPAAWGSSEVLIQTQGFKNYSSTDLQLMMSDLGLNQAALLYDQVVGAVENITLPQSVRLTCIYGEAVQTEAQYMYQVAAFKKNKIPPAPKVVKYSDGDGTVNKRSLEAQLCTSTLSLQGETHIGILTSTGCREKIKQVLKISPSSQIAQQ